MAKGIANDPRHKGGDITGAWKKAEKIKKGLGDHAKVQKALRKANEEPESEWAKSKRIDREVSAKLIKTHDEREKRYQTQQAKQKQTREQAVDVINSIQFGKPFTVVDENEIPSAELREKEVDVKDTRRTDDAIDAYDKSKDASRDADWDTVHGKIKQGKKEKKYAKKERGEIDKDDPNWKSRSYHTGMHGEETEMTPLIQATMEKIHFMRDDKLSYKERQGLSKSQFALPGKGEGPEGKQGGSYPIPDESHARNALARVSQHGTTAETAKVKSAEEKNFNTQSIPSQSVTIATASKLPKARIAEYENRIGKIPKRGNDGRVKLMVSSLMGGEVSEIKLNEISHWGPIRYEILDGQPYWTGTVTYNTTSLFGTFPTEAMALMRNDKVIDWLYTGSLEEVP